MSEGATERMSRVPDMNRTHGLVHQEFLFQLTDGGRGFDSYLKLKLFAFTTSHATIIHVHFQLRMRDFETSWNVTCSMIFNKKNMSWRVVDWVFVFSKIVERILQMLEHVLASLKKIRHQCWYRSVQRHYGFRDRHKLQDAFTDWQACYKNRLSQTDTSGSALPS